MLHNPRTLGFVDVHLAISVPKEEKPANLLPDRSTPATSMSPSHKNPKPALGGQTLGPYLRVLALCRVAINLALLLSVFLVSILLYQEARTQTCR